MLHDNRRMQTRLLSFAVWALVAASALFWGLRLFVTPTALPAQARLPAQSRKRKRRPRAGVW